MTKKKNICKERISKLHGNLVVAYEEGDCLGKVGEIYFDKQTCRVEGISLASKFLDSGDKNFVAFKDIHKMGKTVVIVSSADALKKTPKRLDKSSLRTLNGIRVVTREGEHLGEMADVNVNTETGVVQDILIYGDRKIPADVEKDKIRIGPDMIVVPAAYKATITANPPVEIEDSMGDVLKSAGEATRKFTDSFSAAVQKVASLAKGEAEGKPGAKKGAQDARSKPAAAKKAGGTGKPPATAPQDTPKKAVTKTATPAKKKTAVKKSATAKK